MKKITIGIVLFIFIVGGFLYINGNPMKINQIEKDILTYLVNQKGYAQEDITSITGDYEWMKSNSYYGKVIFVDEPNNMYFYEKDNEGNIYQSGMYHIGKHVEE